MNIEEERTKPKSRLLYHTALLLAVLIWSSTFVNLKFVLQEVPPNTLALLRFLIAGTVLTVVFCILRQPRIPKKDWPRVALGGLTGVALYNFMQNQALQYAGATEAAILTATAPIFMVFLASWFLKEKITLRKMVGIVGAFIGSVLVSTNGVFGSLAVNFLRLYGDFLMLLTGLAWAVYSISIKSLLERYPAVSVLTYCTVAGTVFLLPTAFFDWPGSLQNVSLWGWTNIFYLGILASAFAYLLWNTALIRVPMSTAAVYIYLLPVFSAIMAVIILHEPVTLFTVAGGFLVLAGTYYTGS